MGSDEETKEGEKSESEADADEEASSRESSRRPSTRRHQAVTKKRSVSQESVQTSHNKEELGSLSAPRPSRKTKEAAKSYLNLLGQKLAGKKRDEETEVPLRLNASPEPSPTRISERSVTKKEDKESVNVSSEEVKEEIKQEDEDSNSGSLSKVDDEDKSSSNGSKSPRGKIKDDKDLRRE